MIEGDLSCLYKILTEDGSQVINQALSDRWELTLSEKLLFAAVHGLPEPRTGYCLNR